MSDVTIEELTEAVSLCLDEIVKLKAENEQLKLISEKLLHRIEADVDDVRSNISQIRHVFGHAIDNCGYESNDPRFTNNLWYPKFYPIEYTIERLVNGDSMSRWGDGEFSLMRHIKRHGFQSYDEGLSNRLCEVIQVETEGFCVGIADNYGNLLKFDPDARWDIRHYMVLENRVAERALLNDDRIYHNAYISRPYVLFADKFTDAPRRRFENLKRIWNGRNVIFVEGSKTRMGVGNDLFDNAKSRRRIVCPATDAYEKYDDILENCVNCASGDDLFLLALGPTATVLAYDIFKAGYQAIDLGHLDLEYEWFKNNSGERCRVSTKYNNEYPGGNEVEDVNDPRYLSEIVSIVEGE